MNDLILALRRIYALVYRTLTLLLKSPPRLIEAAYWPTLNMLLMGFTNNYLLHAMGLPQMNFHLILGATILLEFFLRSGVGILITFVEEIYARNIGQLYASPLRAHEQVIAYATLMLFRLFIGLTPALIACYFIFGYNIFTLGPALPLYALILITSGLAWGMLLMCLLLRFGQSAEWFGWMLGWFCVPFIGVYYPRAILPPVMQAVGAVLPPSYVFENLRLPAGTPPEWSVLWGAFALAVLHVLIACVVLRQTLKGARQRGGLLNLSE